MAAKSNGFKSSKKRSHSSPELQFATTSGESRDENVQKILNELAEYKEQAATSAQPLKHKQRNTKTRQDRDLRNNADRDGVDDITVLESSATSHEVPGSENVLLKAFKLLTNFIGSKYSKNGPKKASGADDFQTSCQPRQQRSKSVCSTILNKLKSKSPKQTNESSISEDSDSDVLKSSDSMVDKGAKRKKLRGNKGKLPSRKSPDFKRKKNLGSYSVTENDYQEMDDNSTTNQNVSINAPSPSAAENSDVVVVAVPSLYRAAMTSVESPSGQPTNTIPNTQPIHQVVTTTQNIYAHYDALSDNGTFSHRTVHTQIDYMHCLIPDQLSIINSPYYWGQINRFEADNLLANKPEGTFILRDSTQEEFVFSVSFRRYGRTLHARIEQWNHMFTFDAHDAGVYSSKTICGLLERYKDPTLCMFFEPMLTVPLLKKNPQSLQELSRASICSHLKYNGISSLKLPIALREYLRVYHYKQRLRVRKMEVDQCNMEENQPGVITNTCLSNIHSIVL